MSNSIQPFVDKCIVEGCKRKRHKPNKGQVYKHCEYHHAVIVRKLIDHECMVDECESRLQQYEVVCLKHRERIEKGLPVWLPEEYCRVPECQAVAVSVDHGFCKMHMTNPQYISHLEILEPVTEFEIPYEVIAHYAID